MMIIVNNYSNNHNRNRNHNDNTLSVLPPLSSVYVLYTPLTGAGGVVR